ncbi:hydroxyacid dehydrogenase [uncultured Alsobacter sp.]|uniref:hydroxyacid dehydrogenase n=1 Tax=uncultured Alsobacter sp. TaxID=1748258 RepID=UPI0025EE8604|nr:hydroxyacid dehydrogenase [uncultured Alsobacter sp.]
MPEKNRPTVAVLLTPEFRAKMLSDAALERLGGLAELRMTQASALTRADLPALVADADIALTGWGTPPLSAELLAAHPRLRLVAHSAGSIRRLVPLDAIENGRIRVTHSAHAIAAAVSEFVVAEILMHLREPHRHDAGMKQGEDWFVLRQRHLGRLLGALQVGLVGAGYVGRAVIRLLRGFGCRIVVADPLLSPEGAAALGVTVVPLDELLRTSDVVSLHAPVIPETENMIGAREFALLKDGALFINTARSLIVDQAAQLDALRRGRISAMLDVFATEPLPADDPLRTLPNVVIAPHAAGHTRDTYHLQGSACVDEIERFMRDEGLQCEVTAPMLRTMA